MDTQATSKEVLEQKTRQSGVIAPGEVNQAEWPEKASSERGLLQLKPESCEMKAPAWWEAGGQALEQRERQAGRPLSKGAPLAGIELRGTLGAAELQSSRLNPISFSARLDQAASSA